MFLVGTRKEHQPILNSNSMNCNLNNCTIANINDCICSLGPYNPVYTPDIPPYNFYRPSNNHYERIFPTCTEHCDKNSLHRHSFRHRREPHHQYLPKSLSYAANINHSPYYTPNTYRQDCIRYASLPRAKKGVLRPSKSVPEGLARWEYCRGYRRPIVRNIQVIEQITTSV